MKFRSKKIVSALLLGGIALTAGGCGGGSKGKVDSSTIVIHAANLGYGLDWLHALAENYEAKTGVKISIREAMGQDGVGAIQDELSSLTGRSDIMVGRPRSDYSKTIYEGRIQAANGNVYPCAFEDLSDIYAEVYEGESGNNTMLKKMNPTYLDYVTVNDKQYAVPWAHGFMSFARNVDKWNQLGLTDADYPYTTNQMFKCFDKIVSHQGEKALIYSRTDEYYTSIPNCWFGQYEGSEMQNLYRQGLSPDGSLNGNLFTYDGQVEALKVLETIADNEANRSPRAGLYQYPYNSGTQKSNEWTHASSKSATFTQMQNYFYAGGSVFCLNGTWLEIEMSKSTDAIKGKNVDFIKIPMISAITNKMDIGDSGSSFYIADDNARDEKLAEVVKFVDAHPNVGDNTGMPSGVSVSDVETVRDGRISESVQGTDYDHIMLIPSWSNNKDAAKAFLKYIYSDEGLQIFFDTMEGHHLPAVKSTGEYEVKKQLTPFRIAANRILEQQRASGFDSLAEKTKLFCVGNVLTNFSNGVNGGNFFTAMRDDNLSAEEVLDKNDRFMELKFDSIKGQIGI